MKQNWKPDETYFGNHNGPFNSGDTKVHFKIQTELADQNLKNVFTSRKYSSHKS